MPPTLFIHVVPLCSLNSLTFLEELVYMPPCLQMNVMALSIFALTLD